MKPMLYLLLTLTLIIASACDTFDEGLSDPFEEPPVEEQPSSRYGQIGCEAASFNHTVQQMGTGLVSTLGNPHYDQKMGEEIAIQQQFFTNVPANVYLLNEGSFQNRNAYASKDGNIFFGVHMFQYLVTNYNELAAAGVLAHEWGHQSQYAFGWQSQNPWMELEADAFSGYYMALAKQWAWSEIQGYYANVYATGDYNFHHPTHHGTPDQRLAAAYLGVQTALLAIQNNRPFSYQELHQIFSEHIRSQIASAADKQNFGDAPTPETTLTEQVQQARHVLALLPLGDIAHGLSRDIEITYPHRLSLDDVFSLRPYEHAIQQNTP